MGESEFYLVLVDFCHNCGGGIVHHKEYPYKYVLVSLGEEEAYYKAKKLLEAEKGHPIGNYTKIKLKRISNQDILKALNWRGHD